MLGDPLTEQDLVGFVRELTPEDNAVWDRLSLLKSAMPKESKQREDRANWSVSEARRSALKIDGEDADRWLDTAHKLAYKDLSQGGRVGNVSTLERAMRIRALLVPGVPRGRGEREQAIALLTSLRDWRTRDTEAFEAWLTKYLMQRDADSHAVYMSMPEHAMAWLDELVLLVQAANQRIADPAWSINVRVEESTAPAGGKFADGQRSTSTAHVPAHILHGGRTPRILQRSRNELGTLVLTIEPIATIPRKNREGAAPPHGWKRTSSAALTIATYMVLVFDRSCDGTALR